MPDEIATMDFNDTFLDIQHLRASFPGYEIKLATDNDEKLVRPFMITFEEVLCKRKDFPVKKVVLVEPHVPPSRGPYKANEPKRFVAFYKFRKRKTHGFIYSIINLSLIFFRRNQIPFTPTQVEAIRAGMQPGLTLVVGPPGTGKTDVAVQIISNLYHNFPNQRTLIVTHSNQALNQLFEKIMALDIDERHLLRLGHGEEALETEKDFSRYGRVNYVLAKRLDLLMEVQRLQESLNVKGDVAYTCETAGHFFMYQVLARWERFNARVKQRSGSNPSPAILSDEFPFHKFFDNAPQPLFKQKSFDEDMEIAQGCFR